MAAEADVTAGERVLSLSRLEPSFAALAVDVSIGCGVLICPGEEETLCGPVWGVASKRRGEVWIERGVDNLEVD